MKLSKRPMILGAGGVGVALAGGGAASRHRLLGASDSERVQMLARIGTAPLLPILETVIDPHELALLLPMLRRVPIAPDTARD